MSLNYNVSFTTLKAQISMSSSSSRDSVELHWELKESFENLQSPPQMLSYDGVNNQPLHLANIDFICCEFFVGCPSSFVNRRMGHYEWMARM